MINVTPTQMTVADYCQAFSDKAIRVNRDYQRSWAIWPPIARSFLIESIILGFPIPKLSLHQILDLRSRKTIKEIVDGQQRTAAIYGFYSGDLRLSRSLETTDIASRTYADLDDEHQQAFLSYPLSIDLFVGATPEDIREVFRRMNSHTTPLNPEEERHAKYQGAFKWFIYRLAKSVAPILAEAGVLTERSLIRMQDAKLLTEITHALVHGITTTNKNSLNDLYAAFDDDFPREGEIQDLVEQAFAFIATEMGELFNGPLMKSYIVYSLALAIIHLSAPQDELQEHYAVDGPREIDVETALLQLGRLSEALEFKEEYEGPLSGFVEACSTRTNVGAQRVERFVWLCRALNLEIP